MKTLLKACLGLLLLVSVAAQADFELKPYLGLNMQFHHMKFKTTEPRMITANSPQGNFVVGTYLTDNLAIEAGYNVFSWDFPHYQRFQSFTYGHMASASHKLQGPHLDLVGMLPVTTNLKLIGSIGVAHLKSSWHIDDMGEKTTQRHHKNRLIPKVAVGFRYSITDWVALRGTVGAMDTKKFTFQSDTTNIRPRMNHYTSVGVELGF